MPTREDPSGLLGSAHIHPEQRPPQALTIFTHGDQRTGGGIST